MCFDEILKSLIFEGFVSLGEREGKNLVSSLNGLMLKLIENCKVNTAYYALIEIAKGYRNQFISTSITNNQLTTNDNNTILPNFNPTPLSIKYEKLCNLSIKCLLKLTNIIDSLIKDVNIECLLNDIYDFIKDIENNNPKLDNNYSQVDENCLRLLKEIINELVKIKKHDI